MSWLYTMRRIRSTLRISSSLIVLVLVILLGYLVVLSILWCTSFYHGKRSSASSGASDLPTDAKLMIPQVLEHMTWKEGENVLDYGCGNGAVGYYMIFPNVRKHNGHQYAVEYVASNLKRASTSFPDPKIKYAVGNLINDEEHFPYKNVIFDKIFAIYVFHLVNDLGSLLEKYSKIMRPGGQIGFTTLTEDNFAFKLDLQMSRMPMWKEYMGHYEKTYYPIWAKDVGKMGVAGEKKLKEMFLKAGFKTKYLKIDRAKMHLKTADHILDTLVWLSPSREKIPISLANEMKAEARQQFTNITGVPADAKDFDLQREYILGVLEKI